MLFGRWMRCGGGDTDAEWKAFRKEDVGRNLVTEGEGQLGLMAGLLVFPPSAFSRIQRGVLVLIGLPKNPPVSLRVSLGKAARRALAENVLSMLNYFRTNIQRL